MGDTDMSPDATSDVAVLRELRKVRRERRLGDTEWFDVLYRVYLFALVGTIAVVFVSDAINGLIDDDVSTEQILTRGPSIAGVLAVFAFGIGLRNGAEGGPVSVESADVRHLLMAPISRTRVLLRPIAQRGRSVAFAIALSLGILGQLVAREIDGSRAAWAASGALFGVLLAALYVGAAVVAHALRLPRSAASTIFLLGLAWQSAVAWGIWTGEATGIARIGPANLDGSVLFWGIRQRGIDVIALGLALLLVGLAFALGGRLRLDPLERRGQLVSQLRFAATVQDIRTVVMLRRQLRAESVRARAWFGGGMRPDAPATRPVGRPQRAAGQPGPSFVWRRGFIAIGRLSAGRFLRIITLALVAGGAASLAVSSSLLFLVVFVGVAYLAGLEALEPLSQEIDRPDITDGMPTDRGWLFAHHLVAPAVLLAVVAMVGAVGATLVEPDHAAAAFVLAVPVAWAGAIGAVVTTIGDASQAPSVANTTLLGADRGTESPFAMPEFAGFSNIAKGALPFVFSAVAALPLVAIRSTPTVSTLGRSMLGVALCLIVMVWWVLRRDRWAAAVRTFFAAGRTVPSNGTTS
jgi:hypothetical protein